MKENVLDVLMYLFENYMDEDDTENPNREDLRVELEEAGFPHIEVDKALQWLEGLTSLREAEFALTTHLARSFRAYTEDEKKKLNVECRGLLIFLEQIAVLDHHTRELVIDRVMALETEDITQDQLKWVIMMVLFNQPGQEAAFAWIEDLVFEEQASCLH